MDNNKKTRVFHCATGMDSVLPRIAVPHGADQVQRRVQLDGHVPARQRHRDAVRTVGVLRPVGDTGRSAGTELRAQQDEKGGVVRVQLRRQERTAAVRPGAGQVRIGGRVRRVRAPKVSPVRQVFPDAGPRLQVLLGVRELQLRRLRDRKVFCQRTSVSSNQLEKYTNMYIRNKKNVLTHFSCLNNIWNTSSYKKIRIYYLDILFRTLFLV